MGNWGGSQKPEIPFQALVHEDAMQFKEFFLILTS